MELSSGGTMSGMDDEVEGYSRVGGYGWLSLGGTSCPGLTGPAGSPAFGRTGAK